MTKNQFSQQITGTNSPIKGAAVSNAQTAGLSPLGNSDDQSSRAKATQHNQCLCNISVIDTQMFLL